jgi:hypothetical protein
MTLNFSRGDFTPRPSGIARMRLGALTNGKDETHEKQTIPMRAASVSVTLRMPSASDNSLLMQASDALPSNNQNRQNKTKLRFAD